MYCTERINNKLYTTILIIIFLVFPFGEILKISLTENIKISVLDILTGFFVFLTLIKGFNLSKLRKNILFYPGFIFIFVSTLSLVVNSFFQAPAIIVISFAYLSRFSLYFLLYLSLTQLRISKKFIDIGLLFSGFMLSLFGLMQYFLYPDLSNLLYLGWDPHYLRLFSTLFDPNFTGIILVLTFFHLIFLKSEKFFRGKSLLFILLFIILSASIYLTRSRSTYLALFSGILILLLTFKKFEKKLVIILFMILLLVSFLPIPKMESLSLFRITSSIARINNWNLSWQMGLSAPFFGQSFTRAKFSDASFLYIWAATGLLGLLSYCFMFLKILSYSLKKNAKILIILTVLFTSSWFNNTLFYPWILCWFMLFLAKEELN